MMLSSEDLGSPSQKEKRSKGFLTCLHAMQWSCEFVCVCYLCLPTAPSHGPLHLLGGGRPHSLHTHEKVQRLVSGTFPATFPRLSC